MGAPAVARQANQCVRRRSCAVMTAAFSRNSAGRAVVVMIWILVLAVVAGLAALWPRGEAQGTNSPGVGAVERAEVLRVTADGCEQFAGPDCRLVDVALREGPIERRSFLAVGAGELASIRQQARRVAW